MSDHFNAIEAALHQPQFVHLLKDYMSEISDPDNKREQIAYLNELEQCGQVPPGKILIKPTHWLCFETHIFYTPLFLNLVTSPLIDDVSIHHNNLRVPFVLGPVRHENATVIVDAVVGQNACTLINTPVLVVAVTEMIADKLQELFPNKQISRDFRLTGSQYENIMPMMINKNLS